MNKYYNPLRESFKIAKLLDKISFWLMLLSALVVILNFTLKLLFINSNSLSHILDTASTITIILFGVLKFAINYLLYQISLDKQSDFIDNSFGTSYSTTKSNKYYNNTFDKGVLRMGANSFESCFFTYNLAIKSLASKWVINMFVIIFMFILALQGYNNALSVILQLALPLYLLSEALHYSIFCLRMKNILDRFCRVYNDLKEITQLKSKEPEIILLVINYETTLSTFNLLLGEKVYKKHNPQLSRKWEKLKQEYKIQ